ncbi:MAG: Ubiquinone/menaquinone biosynthesis C-methyltransferase UbiE [Planctomycetes bacterium]|nr:Ubiquinone/menaquinone biosynthesis C-methyltransferase UbiE [Planctomycetota bacterium]
MADVAALSRAFRVLADPARLRLLRALARAELAQGEAARVVALAASTVSKHVADLRDAGLVAERREGRTAWLSVPQAARHDPRWEALFSSLDDAPDGDGDLPRLAAVLRERRDEGAAGDNARRPFVPGRSWTAWSRAVGALVAPGLRVADLGCGDGALTLEAARFAASVVGVDPREGMIRKARDLAAKRGAKHAAFVAGDFSRPLDAPARLGAGSFDVVLFSQSLHASDDPAAALAAARRLLVPSGRVVVLDLLPHGEEWVRDRLGHRRLGFPLREIADLLRGAGFRDVRAEKVAGKPSEPFKVLLATGVRGGSR